MILYTKVCRKASPRVLCCKPFVLGNCQSPLPDAYSLIQIRIGNLGARRRSGYDRLQGGSFYQQNVHLGLDLPKTYNASRLNLLCGPYKQELIDMNFFCNVVNSHKIG